MIHHKSVRGSWASKGSVICLIALCSFLSYTTSRAAELQYIYDNLNRLSAVVQSDGTAAVYNYDAVGNLISITDKLPGDVTIVGFLPSSGPVGTSVTITGIGFSETLGDNQVIFGGGVEAAVLSSTLTTITTTVPDGAITGPIKVTTTTGSDTSNESFSISPLLTSISPSYGQQGSIISQFRITGTNLSGATTIEFTPGDGITVVNPPPKPPCNWWPPVLPLIERVPLITTLPVAKMVTGVLAALEVKLTVTPEGIVMVV